jgi:hypothetical protein
MIEGICSNSTKYLGRIIWLKSKYSNAHSGQEKGSQESLQTAQKQMKAKKEVVKCQAGKLDLK